MKEERFQLIQLVLLGITALGTLGIAISIFVSFYSIRETHEWNRRSHTVELIGGFEDHISKYRDTLSETFDALYIKDKRGRLDPETARKIWMRQVDQNGKYGFLRDKKKLEIVRNQLVGFLNYMEYLAQAYLENTVDQEAFENSLSDPMILYYNFLEEFINVSQPQLEYKHTNWQPVSDVVALFKHKQTKDVAPKSPTGK